MGNLVKAFLIFLKYGDKPYPTHCEHDAMQVLYSPTVVSKEDQMELRKLGFFVDEETDCFKSYRYGSA